MVNLEMKEEIPKGKAEKFDIIIIKKLNYAIASGFNLQHSSPQRVRFQRKKKVK